ncbi:ATP synthase subunit O, mitochondrial [Schistocerca gregaria]|uniref:ATP synthase subunit O, mitochondrial n=1 Tax=Schistocerca gregaria TaxID=7010 RepID=UPI00211EEF7B|nr:ATP synthase subunit O, mitochondrial [Schistocerca gregaria]
MAAVRFGIIARSMKTSAAQQQMVKPPVQVFGLEGRYASALYSAASKLKQLDAVEKELTKFQQTIRTDVKLREFIENPTLKRHTKTEAVKQIASKLALSPPTANLVTLLAENGRLKSLEAVINSFKTIMAAYRGEVVCEVVTASALDDATRKELEDALKGHLKQGQTLVLNTKVDPAIIGGMIVSIGDKYVDMSTASKIKKYTDLISAAV